MVQIMVRAGCVAILLLAVSAATGAQAQEFGRPLQGQAVALERCAACHAVDRGQARSPRGDAAPFASIAATPGMTETALLASLQTSHREMPNLILSDDEKRDVIAYILSLHRRR